MTALSSRQEADDFRGEIVGHLLYIVDRAAGEGAGQDDDADAGHAQRGGAGMGSAGEAAGACCMRCVWHHLPTASCAYSVSGINRGHLFVQQHVITTIAHKDIVSDILHFRLASPKVCIFQSMNQVDHKLRSVL